MTAHAAMAVPPAQYESGGQTEHCRLVVLVHAVVSYVPAAQTAVQLAMEVPPVQ